VSKEWFVVSSVVPIVLVVISCFCIVRKGFRLDDEHNDPKPK
jgi:hypothetical protein